MTATRSSLALPALLLLSLLAACTSTPPAATPSPGRPTPSPVTTPVPGTIPPPSPITGGEVTSAAQAAALVFAANPAFGAIGPLQPDLIGQSAWYEASESGDDYNVIVTVGSGDCQAGCIDRHTWTYSVSRDGHVELVAEEGDQVELPGGQGNMDEATIQVRLVAGPTCPVVQDPPDPDCAPRAVANAEAVLRDPHGAEVGRGISDADGFIRFSVPAGSYYVEPGPVEGLMGQAEPAALAVLGGSSNGLILAYDTGIR